MSDYKDAHNFSAGANTDDEARLIPNGDYRYALNLNAGLNENGVLQNFLGNEKVTYTLPFGNNKCIGQVRDIKRNAIIYFIFNDIGRHSILHYFCATNVIEPILQPFTNVSIDFTTDFLGFTQFNKIHSANIIDNILLWTDNSVAPRKINIKRAKDFMDQLPPSAVNTPYSDVIASGTTEQKIQFVDSIKYAPIDKPTHTLKYDASRQTNFIRGMMIQVRYRWLYDDSEPSAWSTGSYISQPYGEENITGQFAVTNANNYLEVNVDSGHPTVYKIEVAFRFGNNELWYKIDTPIKKYDADNQPIIPSFTTYTFNFYNDVVLIPIGVEEDIKNFDVIPLLAKTQEIVDGNRLVYANNLLGYDNPVLDVSIQPEFVLTDMGEQTLFQDRVGSSNMFTVSATTIVSGVPQIDPDPAAVGDDTGFLIPMDGSLVAVGTVISFTVYDATFTKSYPISYTVTQADKTNWPYTLANNLKEAVSKGIDSNLVYVVSTTTGNIFDGFVYSGILLLDSIINFQIQNPSVIPPTTKIMSFKTGAIPKFGIVYYDAQNRDGGVLTNTDLSPYIEYLPEFSPNSPVSASFANKVQLDLTIRHLPPIWAERYQIVYAGNNLRKYTQFLIKGDIVIDALGNFNINCTYVTDYITKERILTSVNIDFEPGDKLRFIANSDDYVSAYVETTILSFDTSTSILVVQPFSQGVLTNSLVPNPTEEGMLCEWFAYKPTTDNLPYFEIGEVWDVLNPGTANRAHAANIQDQIVNVQNAILSLTRGDCYIYRRYFNKNTMPTFVESEYFSDYLLGSNNIDISRVQAVTNASQKRYEQEIRYGGRYFPGTQTNLILSFGASDYDNAETTFGPINKVSTIGEVLKVLQTKKFTSIYISRNMIYTANGEKQITLSDRVLGTKYPSETDFGCEHPESVFKDDRQLFWFDVNTGSYIQDSANGPFPISDYKSATYFRLKAREIQNKANVFVYSMVDNLNSIVNVAFVDESGDSITTSETFQYNTGKNRWTSFTSFIPDYMAQSAMVFVSMKNGELWVHNSDNVPRNNFYGVQYDSIIEFVSNVNPYEVKVFDSIAVDSNEVWEAPTQGDIHIDPNQQYPQGMETRLVATKFRNKEGVFYSEFLRDQLTPNMPNAQVALLEGRKMRNHCLIIRLKNTSDTPVKILGCVINSTLSRIS